MRKLNKCKEHKGRIFTAFCFDKNCAESALVCTTCLSLKHKNCNPETIIELNQMKTRMRYINLAHNRREIQIKLEGLIKRNQKTVKSVLKQWLKSYQVVCDEIEYKDLFYQGVADKVKRNCNIKVNQEQSTVELITPPNNAIEESINQLEKEIAEITEEYKNKIEKLILFKQQGNELIQEQKLSPLINWSLGKIIKPEQQGQKILFKKMSLDRSCNSRNLLYKIPLTAHSLFEITIKGINKDNRYLPLFICNSRNNRLRADEFEIKYSTFYCGYNQMKNLIGISPTNNKTDSAGFAVDKKYFIEFWPNQKVRYYNEERTLDLLGLFNDQVGPFYLFIQIVFPETSFTIEKLF